MADNSSGFVNHNAAGLPDTIQQIAFLPTRQIVAGPAVRAVESAHLNGRSLEHREIQTEQLLVRSDERVGTVIEPRIHDFPVGRQPNRPS